MKQLKIVLVAICLVSIAGIVIVNSGHHGNKQLIGYDACSGDGFISVGSLGNGNPGGPCLGAPVYSSSPGLLKTSRVPYNIVLASLLVVSFVTFANLNMKTRKAPKAKARRKR